MHVDQRSQTLPAGYGGPPPLNTGHGAATLPVTARPGPDRRASNPVHRPGISSGLGYAIRYFLADKPRRAAMHAARVEARLANSMQTFISRWSQRQIDDLPARAGAKLLGTVCKRALPLGIEPERSTMAAIQRRCLASLNDSSDLLMLYNDLAVSPRAARALADQQPGKWRAVATRILDTLEQALAETLAADIGDRLFGRLLQTAVGTRDAGRQVRETLEQLQGIALWLSSPLRPAAHVLARMLDGLDDQELGRLAAQAWPDLSARDEQHGADPAEMEAALAFISACEGEALAIWRDALCLQLDERKRVVAGQAARVVDRAISLDRLGEAMRSTYRQLEENARTLTGLLPNASVLRARIRTEALTLVIHRLPENWRRAGLSGLRARDLSQLKSSLAAVADAPGPASASASAPDATIGTTVETVQVDMLCADRRAVEDALAAVHDSIARKDRTVAVTHLGGLGRALAELRMTQEAFNTPMPTELTESLRHVTARMRGLLLGDGHEGGGSRESDRGGGGGDAGGGSDKGSDGDIRALRGMSDIELGELRAADPVLSPFGALIDKRALRSVIDTRSRIPASANEAMNALADMLARGDTAIVDVFARLRDVAGILVKLNQRRAAMGEDISADSNDALVHDVVRPLMDRLARGGEGTGTDLQRVPLELPGMTGETLCEPLYQLAEWSAGQPREELARLNACMATLTIAWHLERYLHAAITSPRGEGGGARPYMGSRHEGDVADVLAGSGSEGDAADVRRAGFSQDTLRAAIAGQFGVAWDGTAHATRPCVTRRFHGLVEQVLAASRAGNPLRPRPIGLPAPDGTPSWFFVGEEFARDMLDRSGMALAVEGINPQGHAVHCPGFSAHLDQDVRLAALGTAMHALRELAGAALPALTEWMHGGISKAFAAAVAVSPEGLPLYLPNAAQAAMPAVGPDTTEFRVMREADGQYTIETFMTWTGMASLASIDGPPVALDATRSRVTVAFALAADAHGAVSGLRETVDLRYTLAVLQ